MPRAAIPSNLGVNSDPGKGNLFPAAPPSDSGQREGGNPGEGEGTRRFPRLLKGHESAERLMGPGPRTQSGPHLIPSSWGPGSIPTQRPSSSPTAFKQPGHGSQSLLAHFFGKWLPIPFHPKGKSPVTSGFPLSGHYPPLPLPEGHSAPSHPSASFL